MTDLDLDKAARMLNARERHDRWFDGSVLHNSPEAYRFHALSMVGEAGEVANVVKKEWRGDPGFDFITKVADELGDVLMYWLMLCDALGLSPSSIASQGIQKAIRKEEALRAGKTPAS